MPGAHIEMTGAYIETSGVYIEMTGAYIEMSGDYIEVPGDYIEVPGAHIETVVLTGFPSYRLIKAVGQRPGGSGYFPVRGTRTGTKES